MVYCQKLQKELPGLAYPPMRGPLGERIFREISEEAWKAWLRHSTMVINEYRLNPADPEHQKVLRKHLEDFLFGPGVAPPPEFVPPSPEPGHGHGHGHGHG